MDSPSSRGLLFLLSLGAIPLGCTDGTGESESETETGSTTAGTTAGTAGTTTAGTAGTTTDGTDGTDGTTGTATDGTATGTTASETSTTGQPGGLCEDWATKQVECFPRYSYDEALAYCMGDLAMYADVGPECLAAAEAYYKCEAAAACNSDNACDQEVGDLFAACAPEPGQVCLGWATKYVECAMADPRMIPQAGTYCQITVDQGESEYGAACGAAFEEYYACLAALDCAEFGNPDACPDESTKIDTACQ